MIKQINILSRCKMLLLLLAGLLVIPVQAQESNRMDDTMVSGIVTFENAPVANARISVEESFTQAKTDAKGLFSIQASEGNKLVFSAKGYEQQIYAVESIYDTIRIELQRAKKEQMFQVGYSERSKTLLTAAVSTTTGDVLAKTPVPVINDAVQGNVNGLTIERTSGNEPGWSLSNYYVRGLGTFGGGRTPLFIVDDVERDISQLDPDEIESLTVLKDAAATADYGIRGANGVVYVKTKRGYIGKPEISLKANFGIQTPSQLPEYLGAQEYVKFRNIALQNDGLPIPNDPAYGPAMYDGTQNAYIYANTDWYKEFIRNIAPQQMYRVNVAGGTETVRYYVTLGVTNQLGLYKQTEENEGFSTNANYTRYNVRANTDIDLTDYLTVSLDLGGKLETRNVPNASASTIFSTLSSLPPVIPVTNEDGSIAGTTVHTVNPYGLLAKNGYNSQYSRYLQGNVSAEQRLDFWVKGLSVNAMFAFDSYKMYLRGKSQNYAVYQLNTDGSYAKIGEDSDLSINYYSGDLGYALQTTFKGGIAYQNAFNKIHTIGAGLNYMQSSYVEAGNYPNSRIQNIYGNASYAYDNRYVGEITVSYSGSENFRRGKRFGLFPVVSGAWIVSNESFLSDNEQINFLKLRASYGLVGNSNIGIQRFPYTGQFYLGGGYTFGEGYGWSDGSYEGRLKNANITFEKSLNANIGIDVELFKNRLALSVDLFRNDRSNIITTRTDMIPGIVGQALPYENLGTVLNQGFEVSARYQDKAGDFGYFVHANVSFARNKITYMEEVNGLEEWTYQTGKQIDVVRGLEAAGFFNNQGEIDAWAKSTYGTVKPGDIKYVDQNDDGLIDDNDLIPFEFSNIPELNFGMNLGLSYKNFDLSMLFTAVANRTLIVANNVFLGMQGNSKITTTAYDTWQQGVNEGTAKYPRLTTDIVVHNMQNSTIWSHNGNYIRLQNIEIGYNLPDKLLSKLNITGTRIFVNGYNLLSFDHLKKYNVSVAYPDAGISAYPEMKVYNIGLNVKF